MSAHVSTSPRAARPPIGRTLLVLLAAVVVTGGAWLWAALVAPAAARTFVAWSGGVAAGLLCVAAAVTAYSVEMARRSRDRVAESDAEAARLRYDMARLFTDTLPVVVKRVRDGASTETALAEVPRPVDSTLQSLLHAVAQEIGSGRRMSAAAMSACTSAAARVQAQATRILAELRKLEDRYSEDEVFADLLEFDHHISQMGRLADSIVVLSGGRSGRRWTKPIAMESILRGAMGRIDAYQRVRLHSTSTAAVAGYAAEGVMHTLAELMDNAAAFSAEPSAVHVYVEEEDAGVVVTIEDAGLGMRKRERRRAERAVSEPLDLTTLPGTRLGLAVVGRLASKHGLIVNFRPSSRGGTGVVTMIPRQLVTHPTQDLVSGEPPSVDAPITAPAPADNGEESDGLPKRRRGETLAAASPSMSSGAPTQESRGSAARFAAFRQASGRDNDYGATSPAERDAR